MAYSLTTATKKIAKLNKRIRAVTGGTSASKTISILLYLIAKAQSDNSPTLTSIVSESMPHLKRGAIRDFLNIMKEHNYYDDERWNKTDSTYTFETGSTIEFFSADQPGKVRGPRRHRLFVNEGNNIDYESFDQLLIRTEEFAFIDWNPVNEFYMYTDFIGKREDIDFITLTYLDNEALSPNIVAEIESHKENKAWWTVYGLGQLGEVEGKIYKDWVIIDSVPHEARLERYGVDFGYTNDPTAIVALYTYNGGYILDEITFQKGLSNKQIADIILNYPQALVIADSAEPKSIDEIKSYGLTILPCEKGPDSIKNGIQLVQGQRISVTKNSTNIIKEYRNYMWMTDRDGKIINVPEGGYDHCFAPETLVFTTEGKKRIDELVGKEGYVYSRGGTVQKFFNVRQSGGKNEVVTLYFDDGDKITTTKEHLLLNTQGEWVQAGLLKVMDSIQGVMYEATTNISRESIYSSQMRKVYEQMTDKIASGCMGVLQWYNTKMNAYTSCGYEPPQQGYFQSCNEDRTSSSLGTHDRRETRESKKVGRSDTTTNKGMARLKGMTRMAQQAWERSIQKSCSCIKGMQSLSQNLGDYTVSEDGKILLKQLQNESKEKKITRITRGFRSKVYDLEVENTQCFIANGVVAHNSMDAIRYGLTNLLKNRVDDFDYETFEQNELQHAKNVYNNLGIGEY